MEADDILKGRSQLNRHLYQQKITDALVAQSEQVLPTAYQGFDAESGLARLQDDNGNIFYGNPQTNGAVSKGENIRLRRGGVLARYDAMPTKNHLQTLPHTTAETFSFAALLRTTDVKRVIGLTAIKTDKIKIGLEPRTISISYQGGGLGGDVLTVSYGGGSITTKPTAGGFIYSFKLEYQPDENADGYLYFALSSSYSNTGMAVTFNFSTIFYIRDARRIQKLDYVTNYAENGMTFVALLSVVGNKIYITFKENIPVSTEHFKKITIFEMNRQTLQQESVQIFEYTGEEDSIFLPNSQDWRKSFTHSFLRNPPLDSMGCINQYSGDGGVHINQDKKIINIAYYDGDFTTRKRITFQSSKFAPTSDRCTTSFKEKMITLNTKPEISVKSKYCTTIGLYIY